MPEKSIIDQIKHYQRDIVKCPGDSKRMIRCIERLTVLPITIAHLQETGVGRSVNELRKCGGEVGAAASSLVCKWKSMVKDSDSEEDSEIEDSAENLKSLTAHKSSNSNQRTESSQKLKKIHSSEHHKKSVSSHSSQTKTESRHREHCKDSSNTKPSSRSSEKSHRDSSTKSEYGSSSDSKNSYPHKSKTDFSSKNSSTHKNISSHDSKTDHNGSIEKSTKVKDDKSKSSKYNPDSVSSDNKLKNTKYKDYKDKHRKEEKSNFPKSSKKYDLKRIESSDSSDDEVYKPSSKKQKTVGSHEDQSNKTMLKHSKISLKKRESSDDSDSKSESEEDNEEMVHIESGDNSDSDNRNYSADNISDDDRADSSKESENVSELSERDSEESHSETDNESPEEEYIPVKIKKEKENPEREFKSQSSNERNHIKNKYTSSSQNKISVKQEKDESVKIKKEKDDKNRTNILGQREEKYGNDGKQYKDRKSTSHSESSSKELKPDKRVKVKIEKEDDGSIDCVSGASFADALLGLSDSKKKVAKRKTSSPCLEKQSRCGEKISSSRMKSSTKPDGRPSTSSSSSSSSSKTAFKELDLLSKNIKLEPLDVDLKSTLPEITPNYKPLPHFSPPSSPPNKRSKFMSQEDALSTIMSTKNQRTKVYSGNKTGFTKVPSLFDLCIQVLQNNIEGLEYTGGVPYDLLKPVLDRATADQLHQLEYYNPYLVEDTDSLWKFHCKKEFRGKEPEEFETWRELYLRSLDERERKLKALKENISQSIAKSTPTRQTKLAYIDSVVKPPRHVARQQMKMGTGKPVKHEIVSKAMVGAASGPPASEAVSVPPPPRTNNSHSQFPIPNFLKKKKAPLMAKALQLIKGNRFKR